MEISQIERNKPYLTADGNVCYVIGPSNLQNDLVVIEWMDGCGGHLSDHCHISNILSLREICSTMQMSDLKGKTKRHETAATN